MPIEMLYAAQKGDKQAQDTLMHVLYEPVYHFLLRRTGNGEVTLELCQSVFLKCFQSLDSYNQTIGSVRTWIFRIARNTLFDHYRKGQTEKLQDEEHIVAEGSESNTVHQAEERLLSEYVAQLLALLSHEDADVIALRAIHEMSYEDISFIIGKSEEATRKMYSRALVQLKELTKQHPYDNATL